MTFFNVTFDTPGGIQQYQNSLELVLRSMGHTCVSLSLQDCLERLRSKEFAREFDTRTVLVHDPNHAESLIQSGVGLPRVWFFLHGDYDYYIHAAIRHHLWVDQVVCVNTNTQKTLSVGWGVQNVSWLPPTVPSQKCATAPQKDSVPHLVFVGRLEKDKGAHLLSVCSQKLHEENIDHKLTVIYSSHAMDGRILNDLVHDQHEGHHIELHCDAPHPQVMDCLSNAHALLLPSQKEGFPLSVAEAMSVGAIPIVSEYSPDVRNQLPPELHSFVIDFEHATEFTQAAKRALNASTKLRGHAMTFIDEQNGVKASSSRVNQILELPTRSSAQKTRFPIFRARMKYNLRKIFSRAGILGRG